MSSGNNGNKPSIGPFYRASRLRSRPESADRKTGMKQLSDAFGLNIPRPLDECSVRCTRHDVITRGGPGFVLRTNLNVETRGVARVVAHDDAPFVSRS